MEIDPCEIRYGFDEFNFQIGDILDSVWCT